MGDVAQVCHKGIGFPSEEELHLVSGCARGVEEDTSSNSDRMGRILDLVLFRIQIVERTSDVAHDTGDFGIMKEEDAGAILVNCKWDIGCFDTNQTVKPGKDGVHSADVTTKWRLFTSNEKFFFAMVAILLVGKTHFDAPNTVRILKEFGNGYFTFLNLSGAQDGAEFGTRLVKCEMSVREFYVWA